MTYEEIKEFIARCFSQGNIYWTYHSSMRLVGRSIPREQILASVLNVEVIRSYEDDSPLPSCLCLMYIESGDPVHLVIALDAESASIRIITVYKPDPLQWKTDFRRRKQT